MKASITCIDYADKVMRVMWGIKQRRNHSRRRNCLLNTTYYKLWAERHFAYYIIGQSVEGHGVGGAKEILSQTLMIPRVHRIRKTVRKKPKIVARMSLCGSQRRGSTMTDAMKSDLPDAIWDVMQANQRDRTSGVDKSRRVLHSQSEAFQLDR